MNEERARERPTNLLGFLGIALLLIALPLVALGLVGRSPFLEPLPPGEAAGSILIGGLIGAAGVGLVSVAAMREDADLAR